MKVVAFGGQERERVEIAVRGYERQRTGNWHDDNWVLVDVSIQARSFSGHFSASFVTDELRRFRDQLHLLYASCSDEAVFETTEDQLFLKLVGDGLGQIALEGKAMDQPGSGNSLQFFLALDQSHLKSALDALDDSLDAYPVRA